MLRKQNVIVLYIKKNRENGIIGNRIVVYNNKSSRNKYTKHYTISLSDLVAAVNKAW